MSLAFLLLLLGSLRVAESLRPSVLEMDVCSDFCSLRGVEAIDRSSCNMHEYTSSFMLKSAFVEAKTKLSGKVMSVADRSTGVMREVSST